MFYRKCNDLQVFVWRVFSGKEASSRLPLAFLVVMWSREIGTLSYCREEVTCLRDRQGFSTVAQPTSGVHAVSCSVSLDLFASFS